MDFLKLDHEWKVTDRGHPGIILIAETAFRQDRTLIGALVTSLGAAGTQQQLPAPDQVLFLRRA